jgi:carbamoyltransferase
VATEYLGLGPGTIKAGTLMGLSSYGEVSKNARDNWEEWTKPQWLRSGINDTTWCDWLFLQMSGKYPYVGGLRPEVRNKEPYYSHYNREFQKVYDREESDSKEVMDIAADVQFVAERSLVKYASDLYNESKGLGDDNLCLAGGTMLNCNANYKIKKESGFKNIHLFPACGDDGVSVGSALYASHSLLKQPRANYTNSQLMYLGPDYDYYPHGPFIARELNVDILAKHIADGKIVCWYQGRSEFGPRALGNRSFITDPRKKDMKDILNSRIKRREWFRPFAPVVLNEHKEEWFEMDFESPFMLFTVPCKKPQEIPSAVHIDNTSRVQTLRREDNPRFYGLIESFYELTGVPVVLNTSLNINGRPIVETPDDAMELFMEADADILVINDVMYFKD